MDEFCSQLGNACQHFPIPIPRACKTCTERTVIRRGLQKGTQLPACEHSVVMQVDAGCWRSIEPGGATRLDNPQETFLWIWRHCDCVSVCPSGQKKTNSRTDVTTHGHAPMCRDPIHSGLLADCPGFTGFKLICPDDRKNSVRDVKCHDVTRDLKTSYFWLVTDILTCPWWGFRQSWKVSNRKGSDVNS
jgi:hypothetical protein